MILRRINVAVSAIVFLAAIGASWVALQWVPRSRLFVHVVAIPLAVLAAVQLGLALREMTNKASNDSEADGGSGMDLTIGGGLPSNVVWRRGLIFAGWMAGFVASMWLFGFILGGFLITILFMYFGMRESIWAIILVPAGMVAVIIVLRRLFQLPLPDGVLLGAALLGTFS